MSRRGNCYDNAVMESFFSTVKSELRDRFDSCGEAKVELFDYVGAALMWRWTDRGVQSRGHSRSYVT
jgi:transposase InsO family protein